MSWLTVCIVISRIILVSWLRLGAWQPGTRLRYLVLLRFQLFSALVLLALTPLALGTSLASSLANLFVVSWFDLISITALAMLTAWAVMTTTELTCRYAHERFHVKVLRFPKGIVDLILPFRAVVAQFLAAPLVVACPTGLGTVL